MSKYQNAIEAHNQNMRMMSVVKSNAVIQRTRYDLSLQQQKILMYVISRIKPDDTELLTQQFTLSELCDVCGIAKNTNNLEHIADNIKKISDVSYWIEKDNKYVLCRWFQKATIEKEKGNLITIKLDEDLAPHLLQLKDLFTVYEVGFIYPMESKYSIRLYELLKSNSHLEEYVVSLEELKEKLQTTSHSRYNNFKVKVIDIALAEINKYTDLNVEFYPIREGRSITKLRFEINEKTSYSQTIIRLRNNAKLEGEDWDKVIERKE